MALLLLQATEGGAGNFDAVQRIEVIGGVASLKRKKSQTIRRRIRHRASVAPENARFCFPFTPQFSFLSFHQQPLQKATGWT